MTREEEVRPVPQQSDPSTPPLPRLFGDAPMFAMEGAGAGVGGVGEADDGDTVARPFHGGVRPVPSPAAADHGALGTLLDPELLGARGARVLSEISNARISGQEQMPSSRSIPGVGSSGEAGPVRAPVPR
jgi:hypothetical protein